jgi:hypothetical protein
VVSFVAEPSHSRSRGCPAAEAATKPDMVDEVFVAGCEQKANQASVAGLGHRDKCPPRGGLLIRVVLTAFVCIGGRGTSIAIAAASGGSSSGAAR